MPDSSHTNRLTRLPRARRLTAAALLSGMLVAGCGGSSPSPTAGTVDGASTSTSTAAAGAATTGGSSTAAGGGATSSGSTASGAGGSEPLAFAECMRANGVPNFPDPEPGGGVALPAGTNPSSPAFKAAQAKCQKLTGFGPPGPARRHTPLHRRWRS